MKKTTFNILLKRYRLLCCSSFLTGNTRLAVQRCQDILYALIILERRTIPYTAKQYLAGAGVNVAINNLATCLKHKLSERLPRLLLGDKADGRDLEKKRRD